MSKFSRHENCHCTFFFVSPQIIFEATVGRSYTGDIAIDDIHSETGPCKGFQLSLPNDTETKSTGKELKVLLKWSKNAHAGGSLGDSKTDLNFLVDE